MEKEIPENFEQIEHNKFMALINHNKNIIITIHERSESWQKMHNKYQYQVIGSKNQTGFYEGSFQNITNAQEKVIELAHKHV